MSFHTDEDIFQNDLDDWLTLFGSFSRKEREKALEELKGKFCIHCGMEHQSPFTCQCWNDD